jgi:hypothetical protein
VLPALINLWSPAGVGKSRTQAAIYHILKMEGARVEAPYEFAKELAYQDNRKAMTDPLYVTGVQEHRNWACLGSVDWIVSDSPTGISLLYIDPTHELYDAITVIASDCRKRYRCFDVRLLRTDRPYETYGRVHTEAQSKALDDRCDIAMQEIIGIDGWRNAARIQADAMAPRRILEWVREEQSRGR